MCRPALAALFLPALACVGHVVGGESTEGPAAAGGSGGTGGAGPSDPAMPLPPSRPRALLRRLSRQQYDNTVRDLLGDTGRPAQAFLVDEVPGSYSASVALAQASPAEIEQYRVAAERLAATAVTNLTALLPCQPAGGEEPCAATFIADFGLRALRRPLTAEESSGLLALFQKVRAEGDFAFGIQAVIGALLQSPGFLYRVELPPPDARAGAVVPLDPYQRASRLSYFLLATMPDAELFAAAKANELATAAGVEKQARRLLADPRASDVVADFHAQLLWAWNLTDLQKDAPFNYTPALGQAMEDELRAFTGSLIVGPSARGTLVDLLTSTSTFADAGLAKIYGLPPPAGTGLVPVTLDPQQRAGVLTQAAFLTGNAGHDDPSVVQRGVRLLDDILCRPLPPPPPNVDVPVFPEPRPNATTRERYEQHHLSPCADCHLKIDPLGFALLNYDAVGAYHATEPVSPLPIDASGSLQVPSGQLSWTTGVELVKKMATLPETRDCMSKQWFRYMLRRKEGPGDARSLQVAGDAFKASQYTLKDLLVGLVRTRAFTHRTPSAGEVLP